MTYSYDMSPSRSRKRRPRKNKSKKKIILIVALLAVAVTIIVGYYMLGNNNPDGNVPKGNTTSQMKVLFETSMGNIIIQLRDDRPITTENFKNLTLNGVYDNTIFHRVISDFMIQGGNPTTGSWSGGTISNIQDEFTDTNENNRRTIAMAKTSDQNGQMVPHSGSSQFFINVVDNNYLDEGYSVFGEVIDEMNVVDAISNVETDLVQTSPTYNRPLEDVTLIKATLID